MRRVLMITSVLSIGGLPALAQPSDGGTPQLGVDVGSQEIPLDPARNPDVPYDLSKCVNGHAPPMMVYSNSGQGNTAQELAGPCTPLEVRSAAAALGMGRNRPIRIKSISTLRFTANGTLAGSGGRMDKISKMLMQLSYVDPALRMQLEGSHADGAPLKEIRVFNGAAAWNETAPGLGATAVAATAAGERAPLLKLTPMGALWSIIDAEGNAEVAHVHGKLTLSGVSPYDGFPVTITFSAQNLPEKVEVLANKHRYEAVFEHYRAEVPAYGVVFPSHIVWRMDGKPLADLHVTEFRDNPYVIFPIPAVAAAQYQAASAMKRPLPYQLMAASLKPNGPTPRTPDGHPDLSGAWGGLPDRGPGNMTERRSNAVVNIDMALGVRAWVVRAPYKPEVWGKVESLDFGKITDDPGMRCVPKGLPRSGPPTNIMQDAGKLWFVDQGYPLATIREIPVDGRARDPDDLDQDTYLGIPLGHWEGDTLVIESTGFTDNSWLAWNGYFHTNRMTVVERIRRDGDLLYWEAWVHDPAILTEPYMVQPMIRRLITSPMARINEAPPCDEMAIDKMPDPYFRGP